MRTRIQKWGNSLAVRVPGAFAKELLLTHNSPIDIKLEDKEIIITPLSRSEFLLGDLLAGINEQNNHHGKGMIDYMKEIDA